MAVLTPLLMLLLLEVLLAGALLPTVIAGFVFRLI